MVDCDISAKSHEVLLSKTAASNATQVGTSGHYKDSRLKKKKKKTVDKLTWLVLKALFRRGKVRELRQS